MPNENGSDASWLATPATIAALEEVAHGLSGIGLHIGDKVTVVDATDDGRGTLTLDGSVGLSDEGVPIPRRSEWRYRLEIQVETDGESGGVLFTSSVRRATGERDLIARRSTRDEQRVHTELAAAAVATMKPLVRDGSIDVSQQVFSDGEVPRPGNVLGDLPNTWSSNRTRRFPGSLVPRSRGGKVAAGLVGLAGAAAVVIGPCGAIGSSDDEPDRPPAVVAAAGEDADGTGAGEPDSDPPDGGPTVRDAVIDPAKIEVLAEGDPGPCNVVTTDGSPRPEVPCPKSARTCFIGVAGDTPLASCDLDAWTAENGETGIIRFQMLARSEQPDHDVVVVALLAFDVAAGTTVGGIDAASNGEPIGSEEPIEWVDALVEDGLLYVPLIPKTADPEWAAAFEGVRDEDVEVDFGLSVDVTTAAGRITGPVAQYRPGSAPSLVNRVLTGFRF